MNHISTDKFGPASTAAKAGVPIFDEPMNLLVKVLTKLGLLTKDLDYHVARASMVIILECAKNWINFVAINSKLRSLRLNHTILV